MKLDVLDIVDWIILHRRGKAFAGYNADEIFGRVLDAMQRGGVSLAFEGRKLVGVGIFTPMRLEQSLRIHHMLTIAPGVVHQLLKPYYERYQGWKIKARRRGMERVYDTPRLIKKLEAI